jgi:methylmalonyl-CoA mutase
VEFAEKFHKSRKDGLLVLAGYPVDQIEVLKEAGIDDFVHIRADLIETLSNFQLKLNII